MPMELIDETKEKMTKTLNVLKSELSSLRAGRANAQVLDRIAVDYYGTMTPINQLGNISTPEPRMSSRSTSARRASRPREAPHV